jgi:hypothetical protein
MSQRDLFHDRIYLNQLEVVKRKVRVGEDAKQYLGKTRDSELTDS